MRNTKTVSVWPVGLVGNVRFERPILDEHDKVANWSTGWRPERPFAIDMAGFAINLKCDFTFYAYRVSSLTSLFYLGYCSTILMQSFLLTHREATKNPLSWGRLLQKRTLNPKPASAPR